jgi:hypothetical protein
MKRVKIGRMTDNLKKQFPPCRVLDQIGSQFGGDESGFFSQGLGKVETSAKVEDGAPRRGHMARIGDR